MSAYKTGREKVRGLMRKRFGGTSNVNVLQEAKWIGGLLLNSCYWCIITLCLNPFIWQKERVICFCKAKKYSVNFVQTAHLQ